MQNFNNSYVNLDNDFCLIQISYVTFVTVLSYLTTYFYPKLWIMLKKGTKQYSILKMKCPRCQEGDFFKGHPYEFSTMGQVKEYCGSCTLKYSKEPGFYQGSYYVAYALGVALFVITWVSMYLMISDAKPLTYIIGIVSLQLILTPLLYALSKIIWANMFFNYEYKNNDENLITLNDTRTKG